MKMQVISDDKLEIIPIIVIVAIAAWAMFGLTGCALTNPEGFEFYASTGLRAVDQHAESQATIASPCGGLRGWVMGCAAPAQEGTK